MFFEKAASGRLPARSRIALGLLLCGLGLGIVWALMLIGLTADLVWSFVPWRVTGATAPLLP